jgi:hypothetical protein
VSVSVAGSFCALAAKAASDAASAAMKRIAMASSSQVAAATLTSDPARLNRARRLRTQLVAQ